MLSTLFELKYISNKCVEFGATQGLGCHPRCVCFSVQSGQVQEGGVIRGGVLVALGRQIAVRVAVIWVVGHQGPLMDCQGGNKPEGGDGGRRGRANGCDVREEGGK